MEPVVVLCTFPDLDVARKIAATLVESRLAACVNLCPGTESIYRWQGRVETGVEVLTLIKTTCAGFNALEQKLRELHPYEVPEIIALPVELASDAYARWVQDSVAAS